MRPRNGPLFRLVIGSGDIAVAGRFACQSDAFRTMESFARNLTPPVFKRPAE